jgi:hypothetical protein
MADSSPLHSAGPAHGRNRPGPKAETAHGASADYCMARSPAAGWGIWCSCGGSGTSGIWGGSQVTNQ